MTTQNNEIFTLDGIVYIQKFNYPEYEKLNLCHHCIIGRKKLCSKKNERISLCRASLESKIPYIVLKL